MAKKRKRKKKLGALTPIEIRARLLNADDAAGMALMALADHLTTINKLISIAKLLDAGKLAEDALEKWWGEIPL